VLRPRKEGGREERRVSDQLCLISRHHHRVELAEPVKTTPIWSCFKILCFHTLPSTPPPLPPSLPPYLHHQILRQDIIPLPK